MTLEIDEAVEVVAPTNTCQEQIAAFLDRKLCWLFI
jgi:predicted metal-dependent hydrolase